ncbi:MAG: hypothetical protein A2Y00_10455 [Omnitrophica WOR_2 bacterium GWF2_43_52]|nr:MAG: hypothetical protein A2Y00_10455 [Omnitrophica WOR_2 bacterium GWF2_43_52]HAH20175.1 hypothetical protein [Candidatus Omnitrophota bacterium]HBG63045.1 hypothetical protein [Candidatus Omnitrophota bacterium]
MVKNSFPETPQQILIVEASAGSGKTSALAWRYLKLLLHAIARKEKEALSSILAITFMNKAAVEMKERILELLKRLALDRFNDEVHKPEGDACLPARQGTASNSRSQKQELIAYIGLDEKACRAAAFKAMQEIIRRYDYFQVQTIDSFINSLLLGCAFRLGLSANFNIRQDYNDYIASSLDMLLDLAPREPRVKKLFIDFLWHYLRIENNSGWLAKNNILSVAKSLFSEFNRYGVPFYIHPADDKEIAAKKNEVYRRIAAFGKAIERDGINKTFANGIKNFIEHNGASFQLNSLSSASWHKEEIPCNKGARIPGELHDGWMSLRAGIKELCEMEAYSLFNPYIRIFNEVFGFFLQQSRKEDILFLEELNSRARQLFGKGTISVPEIYYRIGSRFRHFLIDEFQDTSVLQWHNIFMLAEEALSNGGTLFYVGDKKQAIYRFRGGEVELFDGVREELGHFGQKQHILSRNYRSAEEIVTFNNRIFSQENLQRFIRDYNAQQEAKSKTSTGFKFSPEFEQGLLQVFSHSAQEVQPRPCGYVKVERFDGSTEEGADIAREKLLSLIADLRGRGFLFKDIAVLSRSGDKVEEISSWLIEAGIPVESEKTLNIRENGLIKEIVSFLQFLDSPIDDLSFASFILGEIFCAASGLSQEKIEDFIFRQGLRRKKEGAPAAYLYRVFQNEFPRAWQQHIEKFFRHVGFLPLYEMLVTIYADFSVLERFPGNTSFFMSFLELVNEKEDEHNGIKAFLEYFKNAFNEDLYVKFPAAEAVKVMTVHKAKGLEFPVVIIPFLKINPKAESTIADLGAWPNGGPTTAPCLDPEENVLRLLRLREEYRWFSEELRRRYNREYFSSFLDEINTLYVSFTRAKQELYIFMAKAKGSAASAEFLIPDDCIELGKKGSPQKKEDSKGQLHTLSPSRYSDWIAMLQDEFKDYAQLKFHQQIKKGEVVHYALSLAGNLYAKDVGLEVRRCLLLTQSRFPEGEDFSALEKTLKALFSDTRLQEFFFCEGGIVFTEKEVVNRFGDTRRIDRLIVKDNEVVIIDFKTGIQEDEQGEQVKEYIELMKVLYPGKKVRGYLLHMDERLLKEVR